MKTLDIQEFKCALRIALNNFRHIKRKMGKDKGKPYSIHLIRVANRVHGRDKIAAILHDILEDTDISVEALEMEGISADVIQAVKLLTRNKNVSYFDFIFRIILSKNKMAMNIKIADLQDNMLGLPEGSLLDKYRFALYNLESWYNVFYEGAIHV